MSTQKNVSLIGRIAIQLKMITMEQLRKATAEQARCGDQRLGEILLRMGFIDEPKLKKLMQVQRDVIVRQRAKQAQSGERAAPPTKPADAVASSPPARSASAGAPRPAAAAAPEATAVVSRPALPPQAPVDNEVRLPSATPVDASAAGPASPAVVPAEMAPAPPTAAGEPTRETVPAAPSAPVAPAAPVSEPSPAPVRVVETTDSLELALAEPSEADTARLHELLRQAVEQGASDVHIHSNAPPKFRLNGALGAVTPTPLSREEAEGMVSAALTPPQREQLSRCGELDVCYTLPGIGRFRTNLYRHQRGFDVVMRNIPAEPPTLEQLRLPNELAKYTNYHQGMVLLTGPKGCGKSSTMAALVNLINEERDEHILTIEDPIEVIHPSKRCLVNQRHAGNHTASFARALRGALREDPDVIVIGELRDLETISLAMTAAETGHFVLGTLHTNNAVRTINRLIGSFPSNEQDQVRTMLSESLRAVISQRLVPTADGSGRLPALEVLVINKAIGNLIRDEKTVQIRSAIQTGRSHGMYLLEQSLNEMVRAGDITQEEALRCADDEKLITG